MESKSEADQGSNDGRCDHDPNDSVAPPPSSSFLEEGLRILVVRCRGFFQQQRHATILGISTGGLTEAPR
jgi:hypothetical protein